MTYVIPGIPRRKNPLPLECRAQRPNSLLITFFPATLFAFRRFSLFPTNPSADIVSLCNACPTAPGATVRGNEPVAARQLQPCLKAIVDIFSIWESESLEAATAAASSTHPASTRNNLDPTTFPIPVTERVTRLRAEACVKALVDPPNVAGARDADNAVAASVVGAVGTREATGPIAALMREWWPRLITAAADAREWEFVCR